MEIREIVEGFNGKAVMVVGDIMLDRYWWGAVHRISPEAPVPVVALKDESRVLGGAANVAANIAGLGAHSILCGVIGDDDAGQSITADVLNAGIRGEGIVVAAARPSTVKTRVMAQHQQLFRLDKEVAGPVDSEIEDRLLQAVRAGLDRADLVVLSDYAKGCLTNRVISEVIAITKSANKPVIVDPKGRDYTRYRGADLLTPNQKEAVEATGVSDTRAESLEIAGKRLIAECDLSALLITRGEHGMMLLESSGLRSDFEASARDVYDVTGAGDTVIATVAVALAAGLELKDAITIANLAAGRVVEHVGTKAISKEMLLG